MSSCSSSSFECLVVGVKRLVMSCHWCGLFSAVAYHVSLPAMSFLLRVHGCACGYTSACLSVATILMPFQPVPHVCLFAHYRGGALLFSCLLSSSASPARTSCACACQLPIDLDHTVLPTDPLHAGRYLCGVCYEDTDIVDRMRLSAV